MLFLEWVSVRVSDTILAACVSFGGRFYEYRVAAARREGVLFTQRACLANTHHPAGHARPHLVLLPGAEDEVVIEHDVFVRNHDMLGCSVYGRHPTNHHVDPGAQRHQCVVFIIITLAAERGAPSVTFEQLTGGIN